LRNSKGRKKCGISIIGQEVEAQYKDGTVWYKTIITGISGDVCTV
jgi:hypothetical protein